MIEQASEVPGSAKCELSSHDLAQMIDISAVQAFHTEADIRDLAAAALEGGFVAAHALPHFVPLLRSLIPAGGPTRVGGPIGFPSGGHTTMIKLAEARALARAGCDELDMMINIGRLKSGDLDYVRSEIKAVVDAIAPIPLKVILEVSHLIDEEIRRGSECIAEAGAAFVKTGSGWTAKPTTLAHIRTISAAVHGRSRIKASGGIRSLETVQAMLSLGVARFGINTRVALDLLKACATSSGGC
jgi:deoxyribose-phosphate aldolase